MILLYYTDMSLIRWSEIDHRINILSNNEKDKINNLRFDKDRRTALGGKLLLHLALNHYLNADLAKLPDIKYNEYGKPYMEGFPFCFNISHTLNFAICGFSDEGEIGVDIEEIKDIDIEEYHQVLTVSEYLMLKEGQLEDFFRLWTIKEAVMKAEGKGFFMNPLDIDIHSLGDGNQLIVDNHDWFIETLSIENYIVSIASSSNTRAVLKSISLL